jgi:hypothetical protein
LPCVKIFAVRFLSGARQKAYLPCVFSRPHGKEKTHGKQALCRASDKKRTANKIFAVRFSSSARQSIFFPLHPPRKPRIILSKILCRALQFRRTANPCVCRAFLL